MLSEERRSDLEFRVMELIVGHQTMSGDDKWQADAAKQIVDEIVAALRQIAPTDTGESDG